MEKQPVIMEEPVAIQTEEKQELAPASPQASPQEQRQKKKKDKKAKKVSKFILSCYLNKINQQPSKQISWLLSIYYALWYKNHVVSVIKLMEHTYKKIYIFIPLMAVSRL